MSLETIQVSEADALTLVKADFEFFAANVGDEQVSQDIMIEAVKQARLHLDTTFEDKFKWGGAPKPANYNEYRKHRSFQEHALKIYNTLKQYILSGDIDQAKKEHLTNIHYTKGVKTVQFHYILNGILITAVRHGRYKGAKVHTNAVLDESNAKAEKAWRVAYDKVKYGLQF